MRRFVRIGILLLVLAGIAGHVYYWYWPRERTGTLEERTPPELLFRSGQYEACLWIPYPHQNLGKLAGSIDDGPEYVAAAARVAELPVPALPSFGPFALPPSRAILACSDLDGRRFFVMARVYPGLAAVARMSGKLADNPWLSGGEIRETRGRRNAVEERVLHVAWQQGYWTVRSGPEPEESVDLSATLSYPPSLGIFSLKNDVSDLPAGLYTLRRQGEDLAVTLVGGEAAPEAPVLPTGAGPEAPVLLAAAGPAWPDDSPKPLPSAALALFDIKGGLKLSPFGELPGAAVFNAPGSRRWALPTRGVVAGILARNLPRGNAAGWNIVALDGVSLARAQAMAPAISSLVPPAGDGTAGEGGRLVLGLWLRPLPALRLVTRFRTWFEKVPLVERQQVQSWRDWETLLRPLAACERVLLSARGSPSSFLLRLEGCN